MNEKGTVTYQKTDALNYSFVGITLGVFEDDE